MSITLKNPLTIDSIEGRPPTPVVDERKRKIHRFSGISKKQFTDFSRHGSVKENWRTTGQSTAFHAGLCC